jgi:WD40 repeat protein
MSAVEPTDPAENQLAERLLAYDEALEAGNSSKIAGAELPDDCREALSCLEMLERVRRADLDVTATPEDPLSATATKLLARPSDETVQIPSELGRFKVLRPLGQGGCGVVFLAHDPTLRRLVAVKVPRPEALLTQELRQRFIREGRATASLDHPNIVTVFEAGEIGAICYLASAYCPGMSLRDWLRQHGGSVEPHAAAELVATLADAMHYAHKKGIWHRDLKPSNILLVADSSLTTHHSPLTSYQAKIIDFGLAKVLHGDDGEAATRTGAIMGTVAYMAPEQARGDAADLGPHTDVYALGVILFELLAGRPPFAGGSDLNLMQRVVLDEPPWMAKLGRSVHRDLETICRKCLEKEPQRRFASAAELAQDLTRFVRGEPILARPVGTLGRSWRWCRRNPSWALLLALACLVMFVVLPGWWWLSHSLGEAERRKTVAEEAVELEKQARRAAEENANTQHYYSLLNRVRQRSGQKPLGWTWAGLQDIADTARLDIRARNLVDLRSEAATLLAGVDLREKAVLAKSFNAYCLAFSPDGKYLAAGQALAEAILWAPVRVIDVASGQTRFTLNYPMQLARLPNGLGTDGANCIAFSADGTHLAVGARSGQVHCWDLNQSDPKPVSWAASKERIHEIVFHPRQPVLYTASHSDRFIKRWDRNTGKELGTFQTSDGMTDGIALHPNGQVLACSNRNEMLFLDADSLRDSGKTWRDDAGKHPLGRIQYSPDGRFVATEANASIFLIDPAGREVRRFVDTSGDSAHRASINEMEFSPDGSLIFSCSENEIDRTLKIWEVASGRLLATQVVGESGPLAFAVHPQGKLVATAASHRIVLHELAGGDVQTFRAQHAWKLQDTAFSADGSLMACSGDPINRDRAPLHSLSLWDTASGNLRFMTTYASDVGQATRRLVAAAFHPSEPIVAASGWTHSIGFVNSRDGHKPALVAEEPGLLAFDRSGKKLWAILDQNTVQSWHWPARQPATQWRLRSLTFQGRDQLYSLAVGSQWLLAGARDGQTHLLRTSDGKPEKTWAGPDAPVRSVLLSADETWAAVGSQNGLVRILSVPEGNVLATCHDHADSVDGLAIDSTGQFLVTCSKENRVHIYTLTGHQPRLYATLTLPTGPVRGLSFMPHSKRFALIAGSETAVRVWDLDVLQQHLAELSLR